jgi:hypothetical protein
LARSWKPAHIRTPTEESGCRSQFSRDVAIEAQLSASGATWLDRQLIVCDPPPTGNGFGAEVLQAMNRRVDHLIDQDLAVKQGQGSCSPAVF